MEWHAGELFPRIGFIVTNLQRKPENVVRFYNKRGLAEGRFALPSKVSHWSLRSIQLKLIKIGAKVISHARRTVFQMAEVAVPGELFEDLLGRIRCLVASPT